MDHIATDRRSATREERNAEYEVRSEPPAAKFRLPPYAIGILIAIGAGLGGVIAEHSHLHPKVEGATTTTTWSGGTFTISGAIYKGDTRKLKTVNPGSNYDRAFKQAIGSWEKSVGALGFQPHLFIGDISSCFDPRSIACAHTDGSNDIILIEESSGVDLKTVFMHEIGHLLGVPHIEGDDLMNPSYEKKQKEPSRDAVVLAKARRGKP